MANNGNQTVIETKLTGDSTGLVNSVKKAEAEIKNFDKQLQAITTHLNNLANIDLNKLATNIKNVTAVQNVTNISAHKGQGVVKGKGGQYSIYDVNDPRASKDAHDLQRKIIAELREQLKQEKNKTSKIAKDVQWYENQMWRRQQDSDSRTRSSMAYADQVALSKMKAPSVIAYNEALAMKHQNLENYYAFKGKHPEWFVSNRFDPKYQMGAGLMKVGGTISSTGVIGQIAGGALNVAGSFLKSPAMGWATVMAEATKATKNYTKATVEAFAELQSIKTNLSVVYGSQTQADTAFSEISQYAVKSPFGVQQTSELAILLKQSGVYASDLMDTLKMLGDTAGGNMEKMKRVANNYAQIVSIGKASMLDMRQFAYAGIPIFEAVSKELGVSQQQLRQLISDGKVTSDIIEKVFKDLTGINGIFENATQKGAETLKARLQNLQDAKQLALGGLGQGLVNVGSNYGNDSLIYKGLGFAENVYQGISKWANGKNIETSVKNIDNRDRKINDIRTLIEYAKARGDDAGVSALEKELAEYIKMIDPEKDRAVLAASYDESAKAWEEAIKNVGLDKLEEEISKSGEYLRVALGDSGSFSDYIQQQMRNYTGNQDYELDMSYDELLRHYENKSGSTAAKTLEFLENLGNTYQAIQEEAIRNFETAESYRKMQEAYNKIEGNKRLAASERTTLNAQSSYIEGISKASDKTGSVNNNVSEIRQLVEKSAENQKKELEAQIKRLEGTQTILKEISAKMDDGFIDYSKVTVEQLQEWLEKGALTATKLNTNTDNPAAAAESRKIIAHQYANRYGDINNIVNDLLSQGKFTGTDVGKLRRALFSLANETSHSGKTYTDKQFFDIYNSKMKEIVDILDRVSKGDEDSYKLLSSAIQQIGVKLSADVDPNVLNAEIAKLMSSGSNIPLWKRILAQYTGLEATTINGTNSALTMYRDDMAIRNGLGGVFNAMLQSGGNASNIRTLLRTSGIVNQNSLDSDNVYQIDWKMTKQAVKDFAMQLSASTEVITAYNKGLEDQYNTYIGLLGTGILQGETAGNKSRTISQKQLEASLQSYGDQLITAFGEGVTTKDGRIVKWNKDTGFTDEQGNIINEKELVITGKIFDFLEKEIPNIRKELEESNKAAVRNKVYGELVSPIAISAMTAEIMKTTNGMNFMKLPENLQQVYIEAIKENLKLSGNGGYNTTEDLLAAFVRGDAKAREVVNASINVYLGSGSSLSDFTALINDNYRTLPQRNNAQKLASDLIIGSEPLSGNRRYDYFWKAKLAEMGYGDIGSFSNLASLLSNPGAREDFTRRTGAITKAYNKGNLTSSEDLISVMENMGFEDETIAQIEKCNGGLEKQIALLQKLAETYGIVNEQEAVKIVRDKYQQEEMKSLYKSTDALIKQSLTSMFAEPFKVAGQYISQSLEGTKDWSNYLKDAGDGMAKIAAEMSANIGSEMITTGLRIAAAAALDPKVGWGGVAAGLGLAAAGGLAVTLGNALTNSKSSSKDEAEKLESLTDQIKALLEQARSDALYYDRNMRHKEALGRNREYTNRSVNDAIIAPNGNVITTAPDDYLIATKQPQNLVGARSASPVINFTVIDNAGVNVKQQQKTNPDGSVEIIAMIENVVDGYIASEKSDNAFNARESRLRGRSFIM